MYIDLIFKTRLTDKYIYSHILDLFELVCLKDKHISFLNHSKQRFLGSSVLNFSKPFYFSCRKFPYYMLCICYFSLKLVTILDKLYIFAQLSYNIRQFDSLNIIFLFNSSIQELYIQDTSCHYHKELLLGINICFSFRYKYNFGGKHKAIFLCIANSLC